MDDDKVSKAKSLKWDNLPQILSPLGWNLTRDESGLKVFKRGDEQISASRFGKEWKIEHFVNNRLKDSGGFSNDWLSRIIIM